MTLLENIINLQNCHNKFPGLTRILKKYIKRQLQIKRLFLHKIYKEMFI